MQQLLSNFGKKGVSLGLADIPVDIEDTSHLSSYFQIAEFNPVFTAGKNPVSFNGSTLLKENSEIKVECLDSNGESQYIEFPQGRSQYIDVAKFIISIHIYNETYNGGGKLIFVGTTASDKIVRWIGYITIDKTIQNVSKVRFFDYPKMEVRPLLYPVVSNDQGTQLTYQLSFYDKGFTYAVKPVKDTNQAYINPKTMDIDYRLIMNRNDASTGPVLFPTRSFNSQMEGQAVHISTNYIQPPYSYDIKPIQTTASFTVKKVINSNTMQLSDAFYYPYNNTNVVSHISDGDFTVSYKWIAYNTQSDQYQKYSGSYIKESYAEVVYRNLRTFSGYIARHKLYAKSLLYPGDFVLVADETLVPNEILVDPVTANKAYARMGAFYNQPHINKYWFTSSNVISLTHSVNPMIDAVQISAPGGYSTLTGNDYLIVKNDSLGGIVNNATYYPYDAGQFNNLSGSSYTSNFIDLKAGCLYALSMNAIIGKDINDTATVEFYFTSSTPEIIKEKTYTAKYGMKLGEIITSDSVTTRIFPDKQVIYFTPVTDYYGTLVIVPYQCNITISDLSLKVYGDYGFSPDILFAKVPFKIHVANESYQLKAELYDVNSSLIYSDLYTIQSFDPAGESLFVYISSSNIGGGGTSNISVINGPLTISGSLYLPAITACPTSNIRIMGYNIPTHAPPIAGEGSVCYTNVSTLGITGTANDYAVVGTTVATATALSIKYNGASNQGRKILVDQAGVKTTYP